MQGTGHTTRRKLLITCGAAWFLGILPGCRDRDATPVLPTYEVKGRVLLASGQPLSVGRIYFVPRSEPALAALGEIGPDGSFTLATYKPGDGAVPGDYRVRIEPTPANPRALPKARWPRVHRKYTDEDSSGLTVAVKAGTNQLEPIRLK
jgi:hypothetical protein